MYKDKQNANFVIMEWQTKVTAEFTVERFSYRTRFLFAGSCFSAEISARMRALEFLVAPDPFGVLFNPASICQALERMETRKLFQPGDVVAFPADGYGTYAHHSSFSGPDPLSFLESANRALASASEFFSTADVIIITFGTAWVFTLEGQVVANCHKMPAEYFKRIMLNPMQIADAFSPFLERYPRKQWIFTVSPIRHLADGAHGNQVSKASLLLAITELQQRFPAVSYFPSYEILLDELRDYRFYAPDRCHPSQETIDYIWFRFLDAFFDDKSIEIAGKMERLVKSLAHKPRFPGSEEHAKFVLNIKKQQDEMLKAIGILRK